MDFKSFVPALTGWGGKAEERPDGGCGSGRAAAGRRGSTLVASGPIKVDSAASSRNWPMKSPSAEEDAEDFKFWPVLSSCASRTASKAGFPAGAGQS